MTRHLEQQVFGKLTVLAKAGQNKRGERLWLCKCACGNEHTVKSWNLLQGHTKSCGCIPTGSNKHPAAFEIGDKHNDVEIIDIGSDKWTSTIYRYRCVCGKEQSCRGKRIHKLQSCGCHVYNARRTGRGELSGTYWGSVLAGAKLRKIPVTVTIEQAWARFLAQAGSCALSGLPISLYFSTKEKASGLFTASLDRIDSLLGYTPDNIQWVHKDINRMKWVLPEKVFLEYCKLITNKHEQHSINRDDYVI